PHIHEDHSSGLTQNIDKFTKPLVKVAPCEAEARCAALVKAGKVFATATEDMDGLTFGTNPLGLNIEFLDLCILLGCDSCGTIKAIGPKRAIDLIKLTAKHPAPVDIHMFLEPEVVDCSTVDLKWTEPDEEGLIQFMCAEKQFSEDRMRSGFKKIIKSRQGSTQGRLDSFFTVTGSLSSKRKESETKAPAKKKLKTASGTPGKFRKGK
uniref:XPG-I domain-containing protein n=1 Tax=Neogobius melanostomus TaxID=47308 RepID=A0A8C6WN11_9GOBI